MTQDEAYREAEQKIEEARRTGATKLNLSGKYGESDDNKLTELPESLWELTQLQVLNLAFNQLTAVPKSISQLSRLHTLDISYNQLTAIPDIIGRLYKLQALDISQNHLSVVPESIRQLTQLQKLRIYLDNLTTLPSWLGEYSQLKDLGISGFQVTTLPESLANLTKLEGLYIANTKIKELPQWIGDFELLVELEIGGNLLSKLPETIGYLFNLERLGLGFENMGNPLGEIPGCLKTLKNLKTLVANNCDLFSLPDWLGRHSKLERIYLGNNYITNLPFSIAQLEHLKTLELKNNPLVPELAAANKEGIDAVKAYLMAKTGTQITLNEAKLILVGEGEVGKTCLMDALESKPWQDHPTTHGIEIRPIKTVDPASRTEITLNGWDFGGQRVYRPTHQLFFSAPAVYLVVWKPREGPQQGFVKEWIKLIKHREPDAKILVVATHGGPGGRQPDIDRQELKDLFGDETILGFFFVDSKPDENGQRRGITALKDAIAQTAAALPEMGREVPKSFEDARQALIATNAAYLPFNEVYAICRQHKMSDELAKLFVTISHRLGHLIHYEHDPALRDIVILKPDWLTTAISFVLDDEETRENNGLFLLSVSANCGTIPTAMKMNSTMPNCTPFFYASWNASTFPTGSLASHLIKSKIPSASSPNSCPTIAQKHHCKPNGSSTNCPATVSGCKFARLSMNKVVSPLMPRACFTSSSSACTATHWAAPITMTASTGSAA